MTADVVISGEALPPLAPPRKGVALRFLQLGAVAVVLAVVPFHVFELDRFFVPKELLLHLVTVVAAIFSLGAIGRGLRRRDLLLIAFLAWSLFSTLFAQNPWLAIRATAVSASGVMLFWIARGLRERNAEGAMLRALALAVTLVAATSLLQTYGVETELFSENRAPGGTTGNRNFVAHASAFGWPLLMLAAFSAQRKSAFLFWSIATGAATATLVLTRSRGAWLAFAAAALLILSAIVLTRSLRTRQIWLRLIAILFVTAACVAAALLLPNELRWRSDNPYLETVRRVAEYQEGSGRGRLIQYEHSLFMAARSPLFGAGPGNWPVEYPDHAAKGDPSLDDSHGGMTSNPWPSSDWVAYITERGMVGAGLLALFFGSIGLSAFRALRRATTSEAALPPVALLAVLVAALTAGAFDAVLLLALPTFIVWTALGLLDDSSSARPLQRGVSVAAIVVVLAMVIGGAVRSAAQLGAMQIYATTGARGELVRAAQIDPGNFHIRMRLAASGKRNERCEHALAARQLYPHSHAAQRAARGCR